MAARVLLSARDLSVEPGSEVALDCSITNLGHVVDSFDVQVLGEAARWAETGPPLRLMPGAQGVTRILFRVPRSASTTAQAVVFGVQVTSVEDPTGTIVEEALLNIRPFAETTAELATTRQEATSSRERRVPRWLAVCRNASNMPTRVPISAAASSTRRATWLPKARLTWSSWTTS